MLWSWGENQLLSVSLTFSNLLIMNMALCNSARLDQAICCKARLIETYLIPSAYHDLRKDYNNVRQNIEVGEKLISMFLRSLRGCPTMYP